MWKWNDLKRLLRKKQELDVTKLGAVMWPVLYPLSDPEHMPTDPHVTIIYFGEIDGDIGFTKADVIDAIQKTTHDVYLWMRVSGVEWFGEEQNIPVLRVEHDYLDFYHNALKAELDKRGIPYDTRFPEYKPHVTITDAAALDGVYPPLLLACPVELWWGGEHTKVIPVEESPVKVVANRNGDI